MIDTILPIASAALIASLAELLTPRGEGGRSVAYVRMIAGLFLLVALLDPLKQGINILRDTAEGELAARVEALLPEADPADYGEAFSDTLTAISRREAERFVRERMESEFGIPPEGYTLSVSCEGAGETVIFTETRISLQGAYVWEDPVPLEKYFAERLACPCFVTVSGG